MFASVLCSTYPQGGYGFRQGKGVFGTSVVGDYMIAHLNYQGPMEILQDYFQKVSALYGRPYLNSIYWQKLEAEFEFGGFTSLPENDAGPSIDVAPPGYSQQQQE